MRQFRRTHFAAFLVVTVIYIATRLWGLTASCLWFDEIFSVHAAEHDWGSLWSFVALDIIHPPLFYALLKIWINIGGDGLLWLRLLPVLFSFVAIFPFISLCGELKVPFWTWHLALLFLAVNGSLIKYSQEVRMYSLLMCLSLFSMWLFARYFQKGKSVTTLTIVNVFLVWTHYFGWFVILSEIVAIILFQRIKWRPILTMFGVVLAAFVPWIISVAMAARDVSGLSQNIGWISRPGIIETTQFKLALIEPFYFQASNIDPLSVYRVTVPLLLIIAASVVMYVLHWKEHDAGEKRSIGLLLQFVMFPTVTVFVLSWLLPYSIWGTRHLVIVFAPVSILIALALSRIPIPNLRLAAVTLVFLFTGYSFFMQVSRPRPQYIWCAWGQLMDQLDTTQETHIYAPEDVIAYHLWFATRNNRKIRISKLEADVPEDAAYFLPRGFNDVDRVWLGDLNEREFWIAYRSSDGLLPPSIAQKGYSVQEERDISVQNTRAMLVRLRKE